MGSWLRLAKDLQMIDELQDYDIVRVYFDDGTNTTINVHHDDIIQNAIVGMCEREGWDVRTVVNYTIEG